MQRQNNIPLESEMLFMWVLEITMKSVVCTCAIIIVGHTQAMQNVYVIDHCINLKKHDLVSVWCKYFGILPEKNTLEYYNNIIIAQYYHAVLSRALQGFCAAPYQYYNSM